jgi:hypothetical protein
MMARSCLFIFFLGTFRATAFLILQLQLVSGWLWQKTQADPKKEKIFCSTVKAKVGAFLFFLFM